MSPSQDSGCGSPSLPTARSSCLRTSSALRSVCWFSSCFPHLHLRTRACVCALCRTLSALLRPHAILAQASSSNVPPAAPCILLCANQPCACRTCRALGDRGQSRDAQCAHHCAEQPCSCHARHTLSSVTRSPSTTANRALASSSARRMPAQQGFKVFTGVCAPLQDV